MPNSYSAAMRAIFAAPSPPGSGCVRSVRGSGQEWGEIQATAGRRAGRGSGRKPADAQRLDRRRRLDGHHPAVGRAGDLRQSSAGNDASNGLSSATPVRTLAKASSLVRNGSGDEMLLKRGDTWHESLGTWTKSGRSASEPIVIGAYGTGARPTVASGSGRAPVTGTNTYRTVNHLAIMGIRFYADARDPDKPDVQNHLRRRGDPHHLSDRRPADRRLLRRGVHHRRRTSTSTTARSRTSASAGRRSSIPTPGRPIPRGCSPTACTDSRSTATCSITTAGTPPPGARRRCTTTTRTSRRTSPASIVRGNLFADASSHGLQARSGGTIEDNVFLNDPIGMTFGLVNGSPVTPGGVSGSVRNNVFLGGPSIAGSPRGGDRGGEHRPRRRHRDQRQRLCQQPDRRRLRDQPRIRQRRHQPLVRGRHQRPDDRRQRRLQLDPGA